MTYQPTVKKFQPFSSKFEVEIIYSDPNHLDNIFITDNKQTAYVHHADFVVSDYIEHILFHCEKHIPPNMTLRLYDCLRPIEAQAFMKKFKDRLQIADNMLSNPGMGGHPRGMAIDCALVPVGSPYGICPTDYGTSFDDLTSTTDIDGQNIAIAHRNYNRTIPFMARQNRLMLEICLQKASLDARIPLMPLPQEWWDFRLPKNESDYGNILASYNRIILGIFAPAPEIHTYGEFHDYWVDHYQWHNIPTEKKHIFKTAPLVFKQEEFIFYQDYNPLSEDDLHKLGLQVTRARTNCLG